MQPSSAAVWAARWSGWPIGRVSLGCRRDLWQRLNQALVQRGLGRDGCERGLANRKRITPQVVAVQFDQVEGVQECTVIMAAVANEIERGDAVVIAGDRLA